MNVNICLQILLSPDLSLSQPALFYHEKGWSEPLAAARHSARPPPKRSHSRAEICSCDAALYVFYCAAQGLTAPIHSRNLACLSSRLSWPVMPKLFP